MAGTPAATANANVRSLRGACLHWSDARGLENDSLPSGVAGAQIRHQIRSTFVAQSLLSGGSFARRARRIARSPGPPGSAATIDVVEAAIRDSRIARPDRARTGPTPIVRVRESTGACQ